MSQTHEDSQLLLKLNITCFIGLQERIMPEPRGLLKNNDRARSARSLFLRRPRGEGVIRFNAPFHCFEQVIISTEHVDELLKIITCSKQ